MFENIRCITTDSDLTIAVLDAQGANGSVSFGVTDETCRVIATIERGDDYEVRRSVASIYYSHALGRMKVRVRDAIEPA